MCQTFKMHQNFIMHQMKSLTLWPPLVDVVGAEPDVRGGVLLVEAGEAVRGRQHVAAADQRAAAQQAQWLQRRCKIMIFGQVI